MKVCMCRRLGWKSGKMEAYLKAQSCVDVQTIGTQEFDVRQNPGRGARLVGGLSVGIFERLCHSSF